MLSKLEVGFRNVEVSVGADTYFLNALGFSPCTNTRRPAES
jgi:hypothetical protein